ncbi:MAG: hypothetical protein IT328_06330 [Caldilineaceae bacterium]|nr:hypothetical protein [Caldilineaceae bacterium]
MSRRLPGSLLLVLLLMGLLYTRVAWAESSAPQTGTVQVSVSPLLLLLNDEVTIQVGPYTCRFVKDSTPASVCSNLPPGEYEVSAQAEGYIVSPSAYHIEVPSKMNSDLYFRFYANNHQLYMPSLQVE